MNASANAYTTPLEAIAPPRAWTRCGDVWLFSQPAIDTSTGGYARAGYRVTAAYLASIGAEMPTAADLDAYRDAAIAAGVLLDPIELPTLDMMHAAGINSSSEAAIDTFRDAHMMTAAWCVEHDTRAAAQMALKGLAIGDENLVGNLGKLWIAGATSGWARLKGWWQARVRTWVQSGIYPAVYAKGQHEFHDDAYADYSSLIVGKRSDDPANDVSTREAA